MPRVAVMISGTGTLLQSLIDDPRRTYDIVAVAADRPAQGLARAEAAGIPTVVVRPSDHPTALVGRALAKMLGTFEPDWVVSAGFMRILDAAFLDRFPRRVVNSHPRCCRPSRRARGTGGVGVRRQAHRLHGSSGGCRCRHRPDHRPAVGTGGTRRH